MSEYFTFDGKKSSDFGVMISGNGVWNAPARRGTQISVPGRNGDIWVDDGAYENAIVTYPCYIADGFADRVDEFRAWLAAHSYDYYMLYDTYHNPLGSRDGTLRKARFLGPFTTEPGTRNLTGHFDVSFDCFPLREYNLRQSIHSVGQATQGTVEITNPEYQPAIFYLTIEPPSNEVESYTVRVTNGDFSQTIYFNDIDKSTTYDANRNTFSQEGRTVISPNLYTTGEEMYLLPGETVLQFTRTASTDPRRKHTIDITYWFSKL